jgi:hypothetical protein
MTKTKEEILDIIHEESFTEWFLTTQSQVDFQQNKINFDKVCKILDELVAEGVIHPYESHRYSGAFTFLKNPVLIKKKE